LDLINLDWSGIAFSVLNIIVLFIFLKIFLFKPVMGMIEKREGVITGNLNDAENIKREASQLKSNYEQDIKNASAEASAIIKEARVRAELEYSKKLEEAKADAANLIAEANKLIELEKKKAMESAQAEIAGIAMLAAAKVIGKNVDSDSNQQFLGDFLKEVGAAK